MSTTTRPSRSWRNSPLVILALLFTGVAFGVWHGAQSAMGAQPPGNVPGSPRTLRVLIAREDSGYKDAITGGLVAHLKARATEVQVIDVSELPSVQPAQWNAIVLIHTWEMGVPPSGVQDFIDRLPGRDRLVVHTTSGQGDGKPQGVDAVSGASTIEDVPAVVKELAKRVDAVLAK